MTTPTKSTIIAVAFSIGWIASGFAFFGFTFRAALGAIGTWLILAAVTGFLAYYQKGDL